jgi:FCD domain
VLQRFFAQFPKKINRENISKNREFLGRNRELSLQTVPVVSAADPRRIGPYLRRVMGEVLRDDVQMPQTILQEHVAILEAVIAGDGAEAETLSRNHISRAANSFNAFRLSTTRQKKNSVRGDLGAFNGEGKPHGRWVSVGRTEAISEVGHKQWHRDCRAVRGRGDRLKGSRRSVPIAPQKAGRGSTEASSNTAQCVNA